HSSRARERACAATLKKTRRFRHTMTKTCPGCGATAPAEARYCRHCGTALRTTGSAGAETISPLANTEPLVAPLFDTGELNVKETQLNPAPPSGLGAETSIDSGEITIPVVRAARAEQTTTTSAPVTLAPAAQQQAQAKVAEAQGLLSAGDTVGATARLREAIALDPTNAEAHRQLAQLLLESGARQTAIEELRAVTRLEPNDRDA